MGKLSSWAQSKGVIQLRPARQWSGSFDMNTYAGLWDQMQRFGFQGVQYIVPGNDNLRILESKLAAANPIVMSAMAKRSAVLSQARPTFQRLRNGKAGELFGDRTLERLERPWVGGNTGQLIKRSEADDTIAGNSYWVWADDLGCVVQLDPTHVVIATGEAYDPLTGQPYGKVLAGYHLMSQIGGAGEVVATWTPDEVAHYYTVPDPCFPFRGVSWLSSVLADATADRGLTQYKMAFLENAATPSLAVKYPPEIDLDEVKAMKAALDNAHKGVRKAFRTLHFGLGADVTVIGANFKDLDMSAVQGAGENRIAVASQVPATILSIKEGLQGSSLNSGNYGATRRQWADTFLRPAWQAWFAAFEAIVPPPDDGSRLWYHENEIPFLQEDVKDAADIKSTESVAIRNLTDAGYTPESAIEAITTGDFTRLKHSGLYSVQLQPAGSAAAPAADSSAA